MVDFNKARRKKRKTGSSSGSSRSSRSSRGKRARRKYNITKESVNKAAQESGSSYDQMVKEGVKVYKPHEDENRIRILPPTWEDATYWAREYWAHYGVGSSGKDQYLCLQKNNGDECPICNEIRDAEREGDTEYAKRIKPKLRKAVWLIDRKNPKEGPQLWLMPFTLDKDIANAAVDRETGELLDPCDPEEGYDVYFNKVKAGEFYKYESVQLARRPAPLSKKDSISEQWLDYCDENPIDEELLVFYDADHIAAVFDGKRDTSADDDDDDEDEGLSDFGRDAFGDDEDEDEDDSEDEEDEDDEEEEDDEWDDEEEEDEEEEPEPPRRKKKRSSKRSSSSDSAQRSRSKKSGKRSSSSASSSRKRRRRS